MFLTYIKYSIHSIKFLVRIINCFFRCNANAPRRLHLRGATAYFSKKNMQTQNYLENMQLHLVGAFF